MNKKFILSGIILALFVLLVNSVFAGTSTSGDFSIIDTSPATSPSGNPGDTVTMSFNLSSTPAKTVALTSSVLTRTGGTETISAPTITTQVLTAGESKTVSFNMVLPSTQAGPYTGIITGTDFANSSNTATLSYTVTVNPQDKLDVLTYDNATALEIIGEAGEIGLTKTFQIKNTGSKILTGLVFDVSALDLKDDDNDEIIISFSDPGTINPGETKSVTLTTNYGEDIDLDTYGGIVSVKLGAVVLDTFKLNLKVYPEICEDGIVSDGNPSSRTTAKLEITSVKEPDNGDSFKSGDKIKIEVKVKNGDDEDLDVVVEAILYNLDQDEEVEVAESESQEIKDGKSETFEFELEVPKSSDLDVDDSYIMFIKVYEDGDESEHCNFESVNMKFKRDKNDLILDDIEMVPSSVKPGESADLKVKVKNEGTRDQDNAYVKVINTELGISLTSTEFDLDKAGASDDDIVKRFTIEVPEDAAEKDYLIEVAVYDEDDDVYDNGQEFVTLTVKDGGAVIPPAGSKANLAVTTSVKEIDASKGRVNLHFVFTNKEATDVPVTIEVSTVGDWAEPITGQTVNLHPGENNLYFDLKLKEDISEGMKSATVTVKPAGYSQQSYSFNFDVKGKKGMDLGSVFSGEGSTLFWIIGDIVLIVIALFFIKAIFFGRRKPGQ